MEKTKEKEVRISLSKEMHAEISNLAEADGLRPSSYIKRIVYTTLNNKKQEK